MLETQRVTPRPRLLPGGLRAGLALLLLGLCHCGPSGECNGRVGGRPVKAKIDGASKLLITPPTENPNHSERVAHLQLVYDDGVSFLVRVRLPAERDPTAIPFGPGLEARPAGTGRVSHFEVRGVEDAPAVRSGVLTVAHPSTTGVEGTFQAQFEDGSELSCSFDVSGRNCLYEDQPPPSDNMPRAPTDPCAGLPGT
jgi:hypothetical protein